MIRRYGDHVAHLIAQVRTRAQHSACPAHADLQLFLSV